MQEFKTETNLKTLDCRQSSKFKNKVLGLLNLNNFNIVIGLLIAFGVIYYIGGVNNLMVKGFKLRELKTKVLTLQEENREYNIQKASLESYGSLSKRAEELNMVAMGEVNYITVGADLAKR